MQRPTPTPTLSATPTSATMIADSQQLLVVTTKTWSAKRGRLQRFVRHADGWQPVGTAIDVVVGRRGLAWAAEQRPPTATTAAKQEGDGRGPAGVFAIGRVLGKDHAPKSGLPSAVSNIDDVCVDDVSHPAYNRIGRKNALPPSRSAEQMVRKDALYDVVVVVDHNHALNGTPIAGAGSCVFLHVWRAADKGTAGCTAMARDALDDVVAWLDEKRHPLLVQLPADVYAAAPTALGLPAL